MARAYDKPLPNPMNKETKGYKLLKSNLINNI